MATDRVSALGFVVIALPACWLLRGSRKRKVAWLAMGISLTWLVNLLRILVIFWVGSRWGESVAYDLVHPFLGIVLFMVAMAAAAALIPVLDLVLPRPTAGARKGPTGGARTSRGVLLAGALLS